MRRAGRAPTSAAGRRNARGSRGPARTGRAVPPAPSSVVRELQRDVELMALDGLDRRLEVVLRLARHADLRALDLCLDLRDRLANELRDLLRLVVGDAGDELHCLAGRALGRLFDLTGLEGLQGDLAADGLLLKDLVRGLEAILGAGVDLDLLVLERHGRARVLEVEPLVDLAGRLVDGVADFLDVDLGDDV